MVLTIAAFFSEILELVINIVLARELGEEGLGRYMSILPIFMLIAVLASIELPVSISKFVAEKDKQYHQSMLRHAFVLATTLSVSLVALSYVLSPFIPVFQSYHPYVRYLLLLLIPVVSYSAIFRGYFMGKQQMAKIAFANFLRRSVQLLLLISVYQWFQFERDIALFIALCTLIATEIVVLLFMFSMFYLKLNSIKSTTVLEGHKVRKDLLSVSIPMTGVRLFHSITFAIKPFLIKAALVNSGITETMATSQYGKLAGVAFSIGFFPAFIAHSLLLVLIPTVAETYAKKDYQKLQQLLVNVMKITLIYGSICAFIFYYYADTLTALFFKNSPASIYLKLLVPYFIFHYFVIPLQGFLIGMGMVKDAFYHAVWSTTMSFLLMYTLGSSSYFQMHGIIIGMNTGVVLLTLMHYLTVCHKIGITLTLGRVSLRT
ncbi:MAG: polysaccharide biosynthesis protein [Bacillaceae bacterium]|nr:polysaccharide biosynthesis protein [Bacillaceae bacterium]